MNPFNKFEAIGIFVSIAIMAVSLAVVRFSSDVFAKNNSNSVTNVASVVSVDGDMDAVKTVITDSVGLDGELKKLVVDDVRIGSGNPVEAGDTISVHYVGTLRDGTKFDDSYVRGEPYTFTLGEGTVIQGWDEGIVGMKKGGERILVIPPEMAYGNRQVGPIPPNAPLIFKVELIEIE